MHHLKKALEAALLDLCGLCCYMHYFERTQQAASNFTHMLLSQGVLLPETFS